MDYATLLGLTPQPAGVPVAPAVQPVVQSVAAPQVQQLVPGQPPLPDQNPPATAAPVAEPTVTPVSPPAQVQEVPLAPLKTDATPQEKLGFFERLRTDPNLAQSVMMMGLNMMQGPRDGENFLGLAGRSGMLATQAKQFLDQSSVDQQRQAAESQSLIKSRDTQTAATQQQIDQRAQEFPQTLRKLQLDIDNATTDGERKRAEAAMKVFEADPKRMAEKFDLDRAATRANINQSNAAAGASSASARASNALTEERTFGNKGRAAALDPNTTPEELERYRRGFQLDDKSGQLAVSKQKSAEIEALIKRVNPDWTDQQVAQEALTMIDPSGLKGQKFQALKILIDNASDSEKPVLLEQLRGMTVGQKKADAAPAPAAVRFKADPAMAGHTLGETTPQGIQVLKNGKVIGYYK